MHHKPFAFWTAKIMMFYSWINCMRPCNGSGIKEWRGER